MPLLYVLLPADELPKNGTPEWFHEALRECVAALLGPFAVDREVEEYDELCNCTLDPQVGLVDRLISLGIALQAREPILRALRDQRQALVDGPRQRALGRCPICAGAGSYRSVRNPEGRWSSWRLRDDPPWPVPLTRVIQLPDALLNRHGVWVIGDIYAWHQDCVVVAVDYQP